MSNTIIIPAAATTDEADLQVLQALEQQPRHYSIFSSESQHRAWDAQERGLTSSIDMLGEILEITESGRQRLSKLGSATP